MKRLLVVAAGLACLAFAALVKAPAWSDTPPGVPYVTKVSGGFVDGEGKRFAVPRAIQESADKQPGFLISAFPMQLADNSAPSWWWVAHPADMDLAEVKTALLSEQELLLSALPGSPSLRTSRKRAPRVPKVTRPPLLPVIRGAPVA